MRIIITGVAGFIGSTTAQHFLQRGHSVIGIDSFTTYYDRARKEQNLHTALTSKHFTFHKLDVARDLLDPVFAEADAVVHLAGQPGVRRSWMEFDNYLEANVKGTREVLDAALRHGIERVVYASSSSVYGDASTYPTNEDHPTCPLSPYAVTKLAGEQLCTLYASERNLNTVSLRYFTVYGPRQRPDMLTHRLVEAAHCGSSVTVFGDGHQVRDFTFVDDIARANVLAATADVRPGSVFNISGGSSASVREVVRGTERATGAHINLEYGNAATGDVRETGGDCSKARRELDWEPTVSLTQGLRNHVDWYRAVTPAETAVRLTVQL